MESGGKDISDGQLRHVRPLVGASRSLEKFYKPLVMMNPVLRMFSSSNSSGETLCVGRAIIYLTLSSIVVCAKKENTAPRLQLRF